MHALLEAIDIRECRKLGILRTGDCTEYLVQYPDLKIVADLRSESEPALKVVHGRESQTIRLASKPAHYGGRRWFLVDETGALCEVLYYSDEHSGFVSRKAARVRYSSQRMNRSDRALAKRDRIQRKAQSVRGPGAARRKALLELWLAHYEHSFDNVGLGLAKTIIERRHGIADRQVFSRERLRLAKQLMTSRETLSPAKVLARFRDEFLRLASKLTPPASLVDLGSDTPLPEKQEKIEGSLDILLLQRMGKVAEGQLTAFELGWPNYLIETPKRRLFVLIDLRKPAQRCAGIFIQDGRKEPTSQLFWLGEVRAAFNRRELRFYDPDTDKIARSLIYRPDGFVLGTKANRPEAREDEQKGRVGRLRRKVKRRMRRPGFDEQTSLVEFERHLQQEQEDFRAPAQVLPSADTGQSRILKAYSSLMDSVKTRSNAPSKTVTRFLEARSWARLPAALHIVHLREEGYLKPGIFNAVELGWPKGWIGKPDRRLFLLADTRELERSCVLFIMQDAGRKPKTQLFWIWSAGEDSYRVQVFQDPSTGAVAAELHYRRGKFRFPGRPGKKAEERAVPPADVSQRDTITPRGRAQALRSLLAARQARKTPPSSAKAAN
jgi:hypothetical protein